MKLFLRLATLLTALLPLRAPAGAPFDTDDPVPTDYRNYEIYSGVDTHQDLGVSNAELPFFEINYGLMPNVQFSIHIGNAQETARAPQVSFYPHVTFATGAPGAKAMARCSCRSGHKKRSAK
ncbi:MAG TPA: hypothetical protein VMV65_01115 [Alphaproteobacteria bacterium]|nr:hypothetical protein [Alphaproteobacteria bacterium]